MAAPVKAVVGLNIRSGPSTKFSIIDTLAAYRPVETTECFENSWCYIVHSGKNGWVSSKYLRAVKAANNNTECKASFILNARGPKFELKCEDRGILPSDTDYSEDEELQPEACLYTGINFTGTEFCSSEINLKRLGRNKNKYASLRLFDGAKINVCSKENFLGRCKIYKTDRKRLHNSVYKRVSSLQIFTDNVVVDRACFYEGYKFLGVKNCIEPRKLGTLPNALKGKIRSVRLYGNAKVQICNGANLYGHCKIIKQSNVAVPEALTVNASSLIVYTGNAPKLMVAEPTVALQKEIILSAEETVDFDMGEIDVLGADLKYHEYFDGSKYFTLLNGARASVGNMVGRGYIGCKITNYGNQLIDIRNMPVGTYVCVKTDGGRIAEFRLAEYLNGGIKINLSTYKF